MAENKSSNQEQFKLILNGINTESDFLESFSFDLVSFCEQTTTAVIRVTRGAQCPSSLTNFNGIKKASKIAA